LVVLENFRIWWRGKTGLAKAVTILATVLSVATVSCGLDWAFGLGYFVADPNLNIVVIAGWLQAAVLVIFLLALIIVLMIKQVRENTRKDSDD
jgi:hypothetical protein